MEYKDYYRILGVDRKASQEDIKRAYRRLARKYHPDVSTASDAEGRFQEVQEAYEVLKDPEKRATYDQLGSDWRTAGARQGPRRGGFRPGAEGFSGAASADSFSDFFESVFGRGARYGATEGFGDPGFAGGFHGRGRDQSARIEVPLETAFHGGTRRISLQSPVVDAGGRARSETRSIDVRIPAGVTDGQRIRVSGQGARGIGHGGAGDLFLEVRLQPHPLFRVDGRDIHLDVPIAPWEAALGAKVSVPTLGGEVEARVPRGARSGQRLRLKGRGLPGSPPGDQYLHLNVVTPPAQTDADRALYEQMQTQMDFDPRAELRRRS